MLRPGYIFESAAPQQEAREEVDAALEKINPKLRQFYEVKTKIEPFYGGGKLSVLSPCHFACQCGSSVKVISTSKAVNLKKEGDDDEDTDEKEEEKVMNDCFQVIRTYSCETDEIISFGGSAEANVLVTAHKSSLIRLWDLNDEENPMEPKKVIKSFHNTPIIHVAIATDGFKSAIRNVSLELDEDEKFTQLRWATVAGAVVKVWEFGGSQVSKAIHVDNIASIGFITWEGGNSGRQRLFAAERKIYVIDVTPETKQYKVEHVCEGHFSQVTGIEWPGNDVMISGGRDNVLIMWDMKNFSKLKTIQLPGSVEATILVSPSELYLALSPSDVRLYNIQRQKLSSASLLNIAKDETIISLNPISNTPDGEFWVSTLSSSLYQVKRQIGDDKLAITKQFVGSLEEIFSVALWSEMKVAVANNTSIIRVYNLETGNCRFLRGHTDIVLTLSVQKDKLVSGSKDNRIIVWNEQSDEPEFTLVGHIASVTSVCFHPLQMVIFSVAEDTFLKSWTDKKCIHSAVAHTKEIHSVHCSPNGAMLVTASRDKTAKIWDADTLSLIGTLKGHKKSVWDAKFSSWDQLVVTASADTTLKIWNIPQFNCIKTLQGHLSSALQVMFINQGFQILSTSSDGTLKSWDLRSSTCISTYELSEDKIWALDAVPDGSLVVTGSADSLLTVSVDVTEEKYKESMEKRNKMVEDDQRLNNLLRKGEWMHAVKLAIELDRPFTLLKIIRDVSNLPDLSMVISSLPPEHKVQLMNFVKKWNTNSRTSTEAQIIMNIILTTCPPSELTYLQTYAFLPFTQRHFQRVQKNLQQIALVKYLAESVVES